MTTSGYVADWRRVGICAQGLYPADLWTSPTNSDLGQARWICLQGCPVQQQCAAWAEANPNLAMGGVYGGLYYASIRPHRGGVAKAQPSLVEPGTVPMLPARRPGRGGRPRTLGCGTDAGYRYHFRVGTKPCEPCLQARRQYERERLIP